MPLPFARLRSFLTRPLIATALLAAAGPAAPLGAQDSGDHHLTLAYGRAHGSGGEYGRRGSNAVGVRYSHSLRVLDDSRWSVRAGISGGATFGSGGCARGAEEGCAPRFPLVTFVSPLVGLQYMKDGRSAGAYLGPTLFGAGSGGRASGGVGVDARIEGAVHTWRWLSLMAELQLLALPGVEDRRLLVQGLLVGIRIN